MSPEALLVAGYAAFLLGSAIALEWLSSHTHRRSLRYRTAGFTYDERDDHWRCVEGEHLWPREFDHERRVIRYRARAHVCNACPRKPACTDSDRGREIVRPLDPWPHSEAGRFHRAVALMLAVLAAFALVVEAIRNHAPAETTLLAAMLALAAVTARWLMRDLRRHPAGCPPTSAAQGLGFVVVPAEGRAPTRWRSQRRAEKAAR